MSLRLALGAVLAAAALGVAQPAAASAAVIYGDPVTGPADWRHQRHGDCAEVASEVVIHEVTGVEVSVARIDAYAIKSGAMPDGLDGGTYSDDIPKLLGHYGVKATVGSHSLATVERDLRAGDRVIAFVDSETIWDSELPLLARYGYGSQADDGTADHSLVVDSIDVTHQTVTLTDSGGPWGAAEVVSMHTFKAAWATGDYLAIVATGKK